jgi:hypothetical protein
MYWQRELLRDGVSMTFNQTFELDLPKTGILGSLALYIRSAANATALTSLLRWRLFEYISKIEVIGDGSEIIKSYDGRQALASAFFDDAIEPLGKWGNYNGVTHRQLIPIHFGRQFWDELYALDLARWNQVTLKITNDATSTQFSTDIQLTVVACWMRENVGALNGYFREEEWKTWAPANTVVEYSTLPTLLPIRRILLRARPAVDDSPVNQNLNTIASQMSTIEFTKRSGQTRLYRGSLEVLGWLSTSELKLLVETAGEAWPANDDHVNVDVGYVTAAVWAASAVDDPTATYPGTVFRADTQLGSQRNWNVATTSPGEFRARGWGYLYQLPILYARRPDLADMLNPATDKDVQLDITCTSGTVTGGARNAESAIILSRLVR